jgi:cysteine synthase A
MKDRMAQAMVAGAEGEGRLKPGGTIVEYTGGSTGASLALVCAAKGYRLRIVSSTAFSGEKLAQMAAFGAELTLVESECGKITRKLIADMIEMARKISRQPRTYWTDQLNNADSIAGYHPLGEEIWAQTGGKVDGFVSAVGTGGTLAGIALGLRSRSKSVKIALADPPGASLYSYYTRGVLEAHGSSITEGIGQSRITKNLEGFSPDFSFEVPDMESVPIVHRLIVEEGVCLGGSSGVNIAGAVGLARELGPGHVIVTMLCDSGMRYQSKLLNPAFLASKDLPVPGWLSANGNSVPAVFE